MTGHNFHNIDHHSPFDSYYNSLEHMIQDMLYDNTDNSLLCNLHDSLYRHMLLL
jgi:hypothetical protein